MAGAVDSSDVIYVFRRASVAQSFGARAPGARSRRARIGKGGAARFLLVHKACRRPSPTICALGNAALILVDDDPFTMLHRTGPTA
ncbi:MAG: hypothetical protein J0I45_06440 [Bosea sp.]|nr:hypothetical protein [Bosea sp. (in: a-proteobacteria)]